MNTEAVSECVQISTRRWTYKVFWLILFCFLPAFTLSSCGDPNASTNAEIQELIEQHKYTDLVAFCDEKLRKHPETADLLAYKGYAEYFTEDIQQAIKDLRKATELDSKQSWYFHWLGISLNRAGKPEKAVTAFQKALELEPDSTESYFSRTYLADAYLRQDQPEKAVEETNIAIEKYPKRADAYLTRANAQRELFKLDEALSDVNKAIEISPKNAYAYAMRSFIYWRKIEPDKALLDAEKALRLDRDNQLALEMKSACLYEKGDYEAALEQIDRFMEISPDKARAHGDKAFIYLLSGRKEKASDEINKALELDPSNPAIICRHGIIAACMNDQKVAMEDAKKLEKGAELPHIGRFQSLIYIGCKKYDAALKVCEKTIAQQPEDPYGYRIRSEIRKRTKEDELANADYVKCKELGFRDGCAQDRLLKMI